MATGVSRNSPEHVKRTLRSEVGYGCPVEGCASPYLEYHHFDPPWASEHHHRPQGMIALCPEHHAKADGGSFTADQLRELKRSSFALRSDVRGRFEWRRREFIARIGGNFYAGSENLVTVTGIPVVRQKRDDDGTLLLSIKMVTASGEPRLVMADHEWYSIGDAIEFESPPSGHHLHAKYANGDSLTVDFWEAPDLEAVSARYLNPGEVVRPLSGLTYPILMIEITMDVGGTPISFGPNETRIDGLRMRNNWSEGNRGGGLVID